MLNVIWISIFAFSLPVGAAKPNHLQAISDEQALKLQQDFGQAKPFEIKALPKEKWNCELYGMRSRMQVQQKKNFYRFSVSNSAPGTLVANNGVQIFKSYKATDKGLSGEKGPLNDLVRITSTGQLISELTIPTRSLEGETMPKDLTSKLSANRTVIAYVLCE